MDNVRFILLCVYIKLSKRFYPWARVFINKKTVDTMDNNDIMD